MEMDKSRRSCCKDCNAAYKALAARWGKQRSLKAWWESRTADEQVPI
jgi:hypothetical protein